MPLTASDIARVMNLRHWTGGKHRRHDCKCDDCKAIKQVCAAAREVLVRKEALGKRSDGRRPG
jgi:hypothetical protein